MNQNPVKAALAQTRRQLAELETRWRELDATTRARVRPRLTRLRRERARLLERLLRS